MFRGRFVHTIDSKGRVSIPAGFRMELARQSDRAPILTNLFGCLGLYPYEEWVEIEQKLADRAQINIKVQRFQRFLVSGAIECPIDGQGRLLIPPYLRQHAELEREVTIAGVGKRIEVWDKARFDADIARTQAGFPDLAEEVEKLGL